MSNFLKYTLVQLQGGGANTFVNTDVQQEAGAVAEDVALSTPAKNIQWGIGIEHEVMMVRTTPEKIKGAEIKKHLKEVYYTSFIPEWIYDEMEYNMFNIIS